MVKCNAIFLRWFQYFCFAFLLAPVSMFIALFLDCYWCLAYVFLWAIFTWTILRSFACFSRCSFLFSGECLRMFVFSCTQLWVWILLTIFCTVSVLLDGMGYAVHLRSLHSLWVFRSWLLGTVFQTVFSDIYCASSILRTCVVINENHSPAHLTCPEILYCAYAKHFLTDVAIKKKPQTPTSIVMKSTVYFLRPEI